MGVIGDVDIDSFCQGLGGELNYHREGIQKLMNALSSQDVQDIMDVSFPADMKIDIYTNLRLEEVNHKNTERLSYKTHTIEITDGFRIRMFDALHKICEDGSVSVHTLLRAARYFDVYLGRVPQLPITVIPTFAYACLFLATKHEDDFYLSMDYIIQYYPEVCSDLILHFEKDILKVLGWDIRYVVGADFREPYICAALTMCYELRRNRTDFKDLVDFCSVVIAFSHHMFLYLKPSQQMALSIMYAGYMLLKYPLWTLEMEKMTGYKIEDLIIPCNTLHCFLRDTIVPKKARVLLRFNRGYYEGLLDKYKFPNIEPFSFWFLGNYTSSKKRNYEAMEIYRKVSRSMYCNAMNKRTVF